MEYKILELSQLEEAGLEQLARLHMSVMPTLLTDLGFPLVLRYYQLAKRDATVIGVYSCSPREAPLGWAIGSPHPSALTAGLRVPLIWFAGQVLRLAFTRPSVLWQLGFSAFSAPAEMEKDGAIELTYIGVAPGAQGKGLGRALLNAFTAASRGMGYQLIALSVEKENTGAIRLYKKFGFEVTRTFTEGRFERQRMELVLSA